MNESKSGYLTADHIRSRALEEEMSNHIGSTVIISTLRKWKLTSDTLYLAGFVSIAASIATWARAKSTGNEAHAERFGIFVGLWAPTFMALGNALAEAQLQKDVEPLVKQQKD